MITFAMPFCFLFLLLPLIFYKFLPISKSKQSALKIPEWQDFHAFDGNTLSSHLTLKMLFAGVVFLSLVIAAARPQELKEPIQIAKSGRDLMLAIDLSESMQIKDFQLKGRFLDRLTALKLIASDFIDKRQGDRIGLILFGSNAYIQAPLTFDTATVKQFLMEAESGLAGPKTAIGDAIALAIKQLKNSAENARVLVLLTDGNNNSGDLSPEKAAEIASHAKLKIHTIAIGSKNAARGVFGGEIDEKALMSIAEKTGGKYYRAYNAKELAQIYEEINRLESMEKDGEHYLPVEELYEWPLIVGLIGLGILMIL